MAGNPIARQHRKVLDKMGEEEVFAQLLVKTTREFAADLGISPPRLYEWLREGKDTGRMARYNESKQLKARLMAEDSLSILDDLEQRGDYDNAEVALAKARSETRRWYASKLNREEFGSDAVVQVNVANFGNDHLEALRTGGFMSTAKVVGRTRTGRAIREGDDMSQLRLVPGREGEGLYEEVEVEDAVFEIVDDE